MESMNQGHEKPIPLIGYCQVKVQYKIVASAALGHDDAAASKQVDAENEQCSKCITYFIIIDRSSLG